MYLYGLSISFPGVSGCLCNMYISDRQKIEPTAQSIDLTFTDHNMPVAYYNSILLVFLFSEDKIMSASTGSVTDHLNCLSDLWALL